MKPRTAETDQGGRLPDLAPRGRALSPSATINKTRVYPKPLATINNAETRDLGLKTRGVV